MHTPSPHCHFHVDVVVDVDPCSSLAVSRAIGGDSESVASRGNSEVRGIRLLVTNMEDEDL